MMRAATRLVVLAFACLAGTAGAVEFSIQNCLGAAVTVRTYNSTDQIELIPATWKRIENRSTESVQCKTDLCTLVLDPQVGSSAKLSENYGENICLYMNSVGNPEATSPTAYACQPDRCGR